MLEMMMFNSKLFKYREETEDTGLIYNVRYGDLLLLKGKSKELVESLIASGTMELETNNKVVDYLLDKKILLKQEDTL